MHSHELTTGRTFGARFDPGESFFPTLEDFCHDTAGRAEGSSWVVCGHPPPLRLPRWLTPFG